MLSSSSDEDDDIPISVLIASDKPKEMNSTYNDEIQGLDIEVYIIVC